MSIGFFFDDMTELLMRRKRAIALWVGAAMLGGLVLGLVLPPRYEGRVVTMPAQPEDYRGGLSALAGQFAELADFAGLGIDSKGEVELWLAALTSRRFTDRFLKEEGILQELFPDQWDAQKQAWRTDEPSLWRRMRNALSRGLASLTGDRGVAAAQSTSGGPSSWEAYKRFNNLRQVARDKRTGLVSVTVRWKDPVLAARWANRMVARANELIRANAIQESQQRQRYLQAQIEQTAQVGLREALYRISEVEQRKAMLANVREEFAFRVIDPAVPAEHRSSPQRTALLIASALLGLFLGVGYVVLGELLTRSRANRERS